MVVGRAATLLVVAAALTEGVRRLLVPRLGWLVEAVGTGRPADSLPLDQVLTAGCAAVLAACWTWLVGCGLVVTVAQLRGLDMPAHVGPRVVRAVVLTALGVSTAGVHPAAAVPVEGTHPVLEASAPVAGLDGLAVPDRVATVPPGARPHGSVWVRPGDSLWVIARRLVPTSQRGSPAAVDGTWRRLAAANRDRLGPDPDLIFPGTRLRVPDLDPTRRKERP
jgi:hypothetical protein